MDKTHTHHSRRHLVPFSVDKRLDMLTVGTLFCRGVVRADPGVHIEIQAADLRVPRRIICVFQLWLCRKVAFKLYPIEPLNILLTICLDEGVQLTIRYAIERPFGPRQRTALISVSGFGFSAHARR
jgi:hypothetical protein